MQASLNKIRCHCKSKDKAGKKNNNANQLIPRQPRLKHLLSMALLISRVQLQDSQPKPKVMKQAMNTNKTTLRKMISCKWLNRTQHVKDQLDPRKQHLALFKTRKLMILFHARAHLVIPTLLCVRFQ